MELGQLQDGGDRLGDTLQSAVAVEMAEESAQISKWRQITDGGHPSQHMKRRSIERPALCALTAVKQTAASRGYGGRRQDETPVISDSSSAALPPLLTCALGSLPTWPLQLALQRLANSIVTRHAGLLERLDAGGARRFGIQPHDLPFAVVMEVQDGGVRLSVVPRLDHQNLDARITGDFLALLDLIDGRRDGDALFFSRDLAIEGDIGAVLALRNAIDNAELDLLHEAAQLAQPWPGLAEQMMRTAATALANVSAALPGGLARGTR